MPTPAERRAPPWSHTARDAEVRDVQRIPIVIHHEEGATCKGRGGQAGAFDVT